MKYIPGVFDDFARENDWTQGEKMSYILVFYLAIATYGFSMVLAVRNIWEILYR